MRGIAHSRKQNSKLLGLLPGVGTTPDEVGECCRFEKSCCRAVGTLWRFDPQRLRRALGWSRFCSGYGLVVSTKELLAETINCGAKSRSGSVARLQTALAAAQALNVGGKAIETLGVGATKCIDCLLAVSHDEFVPQRSAMALTKPITGMRALILSLVVFGALGVGVYVLCKFCDDAVAMR